MKTKEYKINIHCFIQYRYPLFTFTFDLILDGKLHKDSEVGTPFPDNK